MALPYDDLNSFLGHPFNKRIIWNILSIGIYYLLLYTFNFHREFRNYFYKNEIFSIIFNLCIPLVLIISLVYLIRKNLINPIFILIYFYEKSSNVQTSIKLLIKSISRLLLAHKFKSIRFFNILLLISIFSMWYFYSFTSNAFFDNENLDIGAEIMINSPLSSFEYINETYQQLVAKFNDFSFESQITPFSIFKTTISLSNSVDIYHEIVVLSFNKSLFQNFIGISSENIGLIKFNDKEISNTSQFYLSNELIDFLNIKNQESIEIFSYDQNLGILSNKANFSIIGSYTFLPIIQNFKHTAFIDFNSMVHDIESNNIRVNQVLNQGFLIWVNTIGKNFNVGEGIELQKYISENYDVKFSPSLTNRINSSHDLQLDFLFTISIYFTAILMILYFFLFLLLKGEILLLTGQIVDFEKKNLLSTKYTINWVVFYLSITNLINICISLTISQLLFIALGKSLVSTKFQIVPFLFYPMEIIFILFTLFFSIILISAQKIDKIKTIE